MQNKEFIKYEIFFKKKKFNMTFLTMLKLMKSPNFSQILKNNPVFPVGNNSHFGFNLAS